MSGRVSVAVPERAGGTRADRFVADAAGPSRAYVQRLISEGRLTCAGRLLRANTILHAGDALELDAPGVWPREWQAEAIPLSVVYEDEDLLVVDKPAGLVTHPAPGHPGGTLVNALLAREGSFGGIAGGAAAGVGGTEPPTGRAPKHRTKRAVVADGRPATTGYRVRERFAAWTLLELDLVTRRTPQIRVHLASIRHPAAGAPRPFPGP